MPNKRIGMFKLKPFRVLFSIDIKVKKFKTYLFTGTSIDNEMPNSSNLNDPISLLGIVKYLLLIIQANIYMPPQLSWSQAGEHAS